MKLIVTILILVSSILYSEELPVMLKITSKVKLSDDFRNGVESILSQKGYILIDLKQQEEVLKAQSSLDDNCLDDSCLIDTGKMLAAKELFLVEVVFKGSNRYSFNIRVLDLEKDIIKRTETMYYNNSLNEPIKLFEFAKKLTRKVLFTDSVKKTGFVIPYSLTDITATSGYLSLNLGLGFKLVKYNLFNFTTLEFNLKFYRAFTDEYFFSDIELQYKFNFLKDKLSIGLSLPFRILFNNSEGKMGVLPGVLFEYNIFRKSGFFVDFEFIPHYAISFNDSVKKYLLFKTGINIGWIFF